MSLYRSLDERERNDEYRRWAEREFPDFGSAKANRRDFLKVVGVTSQREIEQAIREAVAAGTLAPGEAVEARVTLELPGLSLTHVVEDRLELG